jgi:hypothetical protein
MGDTETAQLRGDLMSTDELTRLRAERTVLAGAMDSAKAPALASITIRLLEVIHQIDRLESDNGPFPGRSPTYPFLRSERRSVDIAKSGNSESDTT